MIKSGLLSSGSHCIDSVCLGHLLGILACLFLSLKLDLMLFHEPLFLLFEFFLTLGSAKFDLFGVLRVLLVLLFKLCCDLLLHLLLNHATEAITHGIASSLEHSEAGSRARRVFLQFPLELRVEQNLNEALHSILICIRHKWRDFLRQLDIFNLLNLFLL